MEGAGLPREGGQVSPSPVLALWRQAPPVKKVKKAVLFFEVEILDARTREKLCFLDKVPGEGRATSPPPCPLSPSVGRWGKGKLRRGCPSSPSTPSWLSAGGAPRHHRRDQEPLQQGPYVQTGMGTLRWGPWWQLGALHGAVGTLIMAGDPFWGHHGHHRDQGPMTGLWGPLSLAGDPSRGNGYSRHGVVGTFVPTCGLATGPSRSMSWLGIHHRVVGTLVAAGDLSRGRCGHHCDRGPVTGPWGPSVWLRTHHGAMGTPSMGWWGPLSQLGAGHSAIMVSIMAGDSSWGHADPRCSWGPVTGPSWSPL